MLFRSWGWTVTAELTIDGTGEPIDGLRALCAAAWDGGDHERAAKAAVRLGI